MLKDFVVELVGRRCSRCVEEFVVVSHRERESGSDRKREKVERGPGVQKRNGKREGNRPRKERLKLKSEKDKCRTMGGNFGRGGEAHDI
jgi:hypothetical protein